MSALEKMSDHCSIVIKNINELDAQFITQEFLTREILTSLREIHFLQDSFMHNHSTHEALQKSFVTFQGAIASLAETLSDKKSVTNESIQIN
ncbi:hypothetical protein [Legionella hackeliae]|uniref:Uncharacterized protein n=1 Tax=Legionella hackeliae TaxID=449 RepID=A0A0A8UV69_LEGHA|nr:hypothetical protein [Legionella hackeliae]KTD13945.1 hypothetical protein Lhac_0789 [Legionella hackeliae]CEK10649.1 protein of unknown function [Legionella hackeliae]STX47394.1 Uncharacterised protein [Legionella hackeliae]